MENQFEAFIRVAQALNKHKVDYIVVGGVAVILHGMERLTRDLDIFVRLNPENIRLLREALKDAFRDPAIDEITSEEIDSYSVIRYGTPDGYWVDIMARVGEVAAYDDLEFEIVNYHGTDVRIATPATLYHLKKNTVRPHDKTDAMFLRRLIEEENKPGKK